MESVLVVDDDPIVLAQTEERLSAMGYEVTTREKALGTSTYVMKYRPSLMILDINMPALSGSDLANLLRRRGIEIPFILHSGKKIEELRQLVKETGALGAIPKGLTDEQFSRQFKSLVRMVQVRQSKNPTNPRRPLVSDQEAEADRSTSPRRPLVADLEDEGDRATSPRRPFLADSDPPGDRGTSPRRPSVAQPDLDSDVRRSSTSPHRRFRSGSDED